MGTPEAAASDLLPWPPLERVYPSLSRDLRLAAHNVELRKLRALGPQGRLVGTLALSRTVLALAAGRVRRQQPGLDGWSVRLQVLADSWSADLIHTLPWKLEHPMINLDDGFDAVIEPIAAVFESLGIGYYLSGSVASSTHGLPRATQDVDLVAELRPSHVKAVLPVFATIGYVDEEAVRDAIRQRSTFNIIPLVGPTRIDIFVPEPAPHQVAIFDRLRYIMVRDESPRPYPVLSPEDVILSKLRWYEAGNRHAGEQWRDVLGVMQVQGPELDQAYLARWATILGVEATLVAALREAGLDTGSDGGAASS